MSEIALQKARETSVGSVMHSYNAVSMFSFRD